MTHQPYAGESKNAAAGLRFFSLHDSDVCRMSGFTLVRFSS